MSYSAETECVSLTGPQGTQAMNILESCQPWYFFFPRKKIRTTQVDRDVLHPLSCDFIYLKILSGRSFLLSHFAVFQVTAPFFCREAFFFFLTPSDSTGFRYLTILLVLFLSVQNITIDFFRHLDDPPPHTKESYSIINIGGSECNKPNSEKKNHSTVSVT